MFKIGYYPSAYLEFDFVLRPQLLRIINDKGGERELACGCLYSVFQYRCPTTNNIARMSSRMSQSLEAGVRACETVVADMDHRGPHSDQLSF